MNDNWTNTDIVKIRSSWADVMALNYYKDQDFVDKLFTDLVNGNKDARASLEDPKVYAEQKELFAEILKFTMLYLHKRQMLEECMKEFISENPLLVVYGVTYLEPLGSVMIKALRQTLGNEKFKPDLEGLWVKLYIFIANSILLNEDAASESEEESNSLSEESTPPLRLQGTSSYTTVPPKPAGTGLGRISIDLGKNEMYRGFRRNSLALEGPTLSLVVPPAISSTILCSSSIINEPYEEPVLTPRSVRRNTDNMMEKLGLGIEQTASPKHKLNAPFDPRRKPSHKRNQSESHIPFLQHERHNSYSSSNASVSTVDDKFEDEINFSLPEEPKASVFDTKSFGIGALAPIAESDPDCADDSSSTTSSRYGLDDSAMEASSGSSSLSLHNSDYKSSISSGSGHSTHETNFKTNNTPLASPQPRSFGFPPISKQYDSPYANKMYLSSVPHFSALNNNRASAGFMRSSYVLKKGMGDNADQSDAASIVRSQSTGKSYARSVFSLPPGKSANEERTYSFSKPRMPSSFESQSFRTPSPKVELLPRQNTILKTKNSLQNISNTQMPQIQDKALIRSSLKESKPKKSFFKKLLNIFGSSSTEPREISSPMNVKHVNGATNSLASMGISSRISSSDVRSKPATMARADIHSDMRSGMESVKTSRSLFKNKPVDPTMEKGKPNKYLVKKVPYKTIYMKDLIT